MIDSGREPGAREVVVHAMPFGITLPSKKMMDKDATTGKGVPRVAVRDHRGSDGPGHPAPDDCPDTPPAEPLGGEWTLVEDAGDPQALLDLWQSLLDQRPKAPQPRAGGHRRSIGMRSFPIRRSGPDCSRRTGSRSEWRASMPGHQSSGEPNRAFDPVGHMEQGGDQVPRARDMATQWNSFKADKGNRVTSGLAVQTGSGRRVVQAHARRLDVLLTAHADQAPGSGDRRHPHPAPDLDFDLVPAVLRTRAMEISEHIGCDPLVPL